MPCSDRPRVRARAAAVFIVVFITGVAAAAQPTTGPRFTAVSGMIRVVDGPWEFLPGILATPDSPAWAAARLVTLPEPWNDYSWPGKDSGVPEGIGTYRIRLGIPNNGELWAIKWTLAGSAARIWWQGQPIHESGRPGTEYRLEVPGNAPGIIPLPGGGPGWLVVQVSNFHHVDGGLWGPLSVGPFSLLESAGDRESAGDLLLAGGFILFGLLGMLAAGILRKEWASLWFGLLSLTIGVSLFCNGAMTVYQLAPDMGWEWFNKIRHLAMYLAPLWFMFFLASLIPGCFAAWFRYAFTAIPVLGALVVLALPYRWYGNLFYAWAIILAVALAYALAALFRAYRKRHRLAGTSLAGILLFLSGTAYEFIRTAWYLPTPNVFALTTFGFLAFMAIALGLHIAATYRSIDRLNHEMGSMNRSMHRFLPEAFLSLLGKGSLTEVELGQSRRMDMAVLFSDIRGFSALTQDMTPEEIFALINTFLGAVGPAIRQHGGFVDKYLGDGIMALFPAGGAAAMDAACAMHQALDRFNAQRREEEKPELAIGIGIHAGPVLLGTVGEDERMDSTVISVVVNLASRLESLTRDYDARIIVSPQVIMDLPPDSPHEHRFLGFETIKGFDAPQPAYEVFSADQLAIAAQKRQSKAELEEALILFGRHEYHAAARAFAALNRQFPADPAPRTYLERIRAIREKRIMFQVMNHLKRKSLAKAGT